MEPAAAAVPNKAACGLFDLQDGGVGLHDGDDDLIDVILESVVDLLLFVNSLH